MTSVKIFDNVFMENKSEEVRIAEEKRQKIERFTQFFGRVNSAFTFRKVTVKVEDSPIGAPAWSGASEVTFNSRLLDLDSPQSIAGLKGLDLHEISHILYTPREGSEIFDYVKENDYLQAYNCLEDQRIETLFTSKYPSTIDWFTATILIHFVDKPDAFNASYPLLRGRRYLPVELRARSRNAYANQSDLDEICEIVDAYRTLIFPTDTEQGKDLIARFHNLLPKQDSPAGEGQGQGTQTVTVRIQDPFGHGERPQEGIESSVDSRPVSPLKQKQDRARSQATDGEDDSALADSLRNDDLVIDIDLSGAGDDGDAGDADDADDADSLDSDNSSDGNSAGDSAGDMTIIQDFLDDILSNENVASEINDIIRQIGGLPSLSTNDSKEPTIKDYMSLSPDADTFHASLSFGRELERLKASFDPAWDKYESQGRIDAHRYLRGDDLDTVFDQWNEGREDATEISCVIMLDTSGSMSGTKATSAYKAMYAIKRALDKINAECTVITFNDSVHTLYRASDRAGNTLRHAGTGGGTTADQAIRYATKVLAETEKPVRVLFAITDGDWYGDQNLNHEAISRLARAGVLTALAYIPEKESSVNLADIDSHQCEIKAIVRNPIDLIGMARSITRYAINRRLINN
jgi:uncharacterized protein YegL